MQFSAAFYYFLLYVFVSIIGVCLFSKFGIHGLGLCVHVCECALTNASILGYAPNG
jgi:hypothetical protein